MLSDMEASCLATALAVCLNKEEEKCRWMEWLKKKNEYTHENLLKDLRLSETSDFQNFLRLDATSFDDLLKMITPQIEKRNATMGDAIPPSQRLSDSCSPSSWIVFSDIHRSSWPTRNFISSKYHNVGSTTSSAPVSLFSESFICFNSLLKLVRKELNFLINWLLSASRNLSLYLRSRCSYCSIF